MHEDEDEDDQPLVRPASRKEPTEDGRDPSIVDGDLVPFLPPRLPSAAPVRKRKGPPEWKDPAATLQKTRVSEQRIPRLWAKRQKVKLYATLPASCLKSTN